MGGSGEDEPAGGGGARCWRGSVVAPPALPPPSARTHTCAHADTLFLYFPSTAYHVIVETYAGERADMCSGPGVRREAEGYTVRCR